MHRASYRFMPLCGITETLSDVESVRVVHDRRYSQIIFEMIGLVGDELVEKNYTMFIKPAINKLVEVKDFPLGDSVNFVTPII